MNEKIEVEVSPSGTMRKIYVDVDEFKTLMERAGGRVVDIRRASDVEWEDIGDGGWTVRAHHDRELAIRYLSKDKGDHRIGVSREGDLAIWSGREAALRAEKQFFFQLLPPII